MVAEFLDAEDRSQTNGLQFFARQVVEGFCGGLHRSPHKGVSVEFKQHRQYVHGDEIRHLDWRVFGKTDRFYIREYEEETNLRSTLLLDCSGSMGYESPLKRRSKDKEPIPTKLEFAKRLAACFAYMMLGQQDSVGITTFDKRIRDVAPNRSRPNHLRTLTEILEKAKPGGEGDLGDILGKVTAKLGRRGLVVILSDCFADADSLLKGLAQIRHLKHEVIVFQIWDRDELEFPFKQWTRFDCLEVAGVRQMVDPAHLRSAYMENLAKFRDSIQQVCDRTRIDLVPMVTDEPYAKALASYMTSRNRKRRR